MPTLDPSQIVAALADPSDDDTDVPEASDAYQPTADDERRCEERLAYARALLASSPMGAISVSATVASVDAARAFVASSPHKGDKVVRLARLLLIDAARILAGAADKCPV